MCAAIALLVGVGAGSAEARPASSGVYTEGGLGGTVFLGDAKNYSKTGLAFSGRVGYELFPWLSLGLSLGASTHEATVPPPPEGEYYQLYHAAGDARLGVLFGALGVFAEGGVGAAMVSTNILSKVQILDPDERFTLAFHAGGGFEYQLQNRHYAFGTAAEWMLMPQFAATQGVTVRAYLRYTY